MLNTSGLVILAATLASPLCAQYELNKTFSWSKQVGSPSSYSAYVNAQLSVYNKSHLEVDASAQAAAGGAIIGYSTELLNLNSLAYASATSGVHADVAVKVLGQTVFQNAWDRTSLSISKTPFTKTFDKAYNGQVVIAAVPVAYTVGVTGKAGLNFLFNLQAGPATSLTITPQVSATTYGRLGVGIACCLTAGIGANLTVIDEQLPMTAGAKMQPDPAHIVPSWGVKFYANITSDMNLLAGKVYAFVKVGVWKFKKTFTATLFKWDGFRYKTTLFDTSAWVSINEPFPRLTSISPSSVNVGATDFTITVNGGGFGSYSTVLWNGSALSTTLISSSQLRATVPGALRNFTNPATATIKVQNAGPFPGSSSSVTFPILVPIPTLVSMTPGAATVGGGSFVMTLSGTNLVPGSTVYWNSTPLTATYVSNFQAQATVPDYLSASPGTAQITFHAGGVATSNPLSIRVFDAEPTVSAVSPGSAWPGSSPITITVTGTGYLPTSVVYWSGSPLATTYQNGGSLQAVVTSSMLATPMTEAIGVITPGHTPSNVVSFAVANRTYTAREAPVPGGFITNLVPTGINDNGTISGFAYGSTPYRQYGFGWFAPIASCCITTMSDGAQGYNAALAFSAFPDAMAWSVKPNADLIVGWNTANNPSGLQAQYLGFGLGNDYNNGYFAMNDINSNGMVVGPDQSSNYNLVMGQYNGAASYVGSGAYSMSTYGGYWYGYNLVPARKSNPQRTAGVRPVAINNNNDVLALDGSYWIGGGGAPQRLPGGSPGSIWATGFNDSRTAVGVIGQNSNPSYLTGLQAVQWNPDGSITNLNFGGGVPLHINNSGDIVGEDASYQGVLYSGGSLHNLNSLLSNTVNGTIGTAVGISNNGKIVAILYHPDTTLGAVVLTQDTPAPPPPSPTAQTLITESLRLHPRTATFHANDVSLSVTTLSPAFVQAGTGDFQLTITGTGFVNGTLAYWNGDPLATTYNSATSLTATVPAALIAVGGSATVTAINPGGATSGAVVLPINNPTPTVSSLAPSSIAATSTGVSLIVSGTGFMPGSVVYWSGTALTTTYNSSTQVTAAVPDSYVTDPGTAAITVVNPNPGGSSSDPVALPITTPTPTLTSIGTTSVVAGAAGFTLNVTGTGFDPTSVVVFDDNQLTTTYVSPTSLTAQVPQSVLTTPASVLVKVTDSIDGSGTSQSIEFNINNPAPQMSNISPTSVAYGANSLSLTVNGSGFVNGSQVYLNDNPVPTTYVSATQLTAAVAASDILLAADNPTAQVTVQNPTPSAAPVSGAATLTIVSPPTVETMTPGMAREGSSTLTVTLTGTGFTPQSVVTFNGTPLSTTYTSSTQISASLTTALLAVAGDFPLRIVQGSPSDPTAGVSDAVAFSVSAVAPPAPTITSISPTSTVAGSGDQIVTINGTGFNSATKGLWNGSTVLSTAFVTPTQVMLLVPAANVVTPGTVTIQMQNPPDNTSAGGGTSASVKFNILSSAGSAVQITATNLLGRDGFNNILVQVTLTNGGTATASNVVLTGAKIGAFSGTPLPQTAGTILPNSSTQVLVTVPASAGLSGTATTLALTGTYTGGSFTSTARITLP